MMSLFFGILGLAWSVGGIYVHGDTGLIDIAIGAIFFTSSVILNRLKESK